MNNLRGLKGNAEYKGICITDDYTLSERQMTKEFVNKAKENNSLEPENSNFFLESPGNSKKRVSSKAIHESKATVGGTELIKTNIT